MTASRSQHETGAEPIGHVTVDRVRGTVVVRTPDGTDVVVDLSVHRADVVRRLLDLGVSVETLRAILPQWCGLISDVATGNDGCSPTGRVN